MNLLSPRLFEASVKDLFKSSILDEYDVKVFKDRSSGIRVELDKDKTVVASLTLSSATNYTFGKYIPIKSVFVEPPFRRLGIYARLLDMLESNDIVISKNAKGFISLPYDSEGFGDKRSEDADKFWEGMIKKYPNKIEKKVEEDGNIYLYKF